MAKIQTAVLLVEGKDDQHVIWSLLQKFQIPESFEVIDCGGLSKLKNGEDNDKKGKENLMEGIGARLKKPELQRLGVVVDADADILAQWQSLRDIFQKSGFSFPPNIPENGLILEEKGKKIGVWIMPNNQTNGMLEDFVKFLIPENDSLLPKVERILTEIENENLNKYSAIHKPKALIHTWLAWQEESGKPMGVAITARYLASENKELCQKFIDWIRKLFIEI